MTLRLIRRCLEYVCAHERATKVPKKCPSSAKLSKDLRGGSDGMSRAVADNFILSAADLPDLPLPPIEVDTRNLHVFHYPAAVSFVPFVALRPRCLQFLCVALVI